MSPATACALTAHEVVGLNSPANGVVVGSDGNIWAAEEAAGTVVRLTPAGQVLAHYPVGPEPTSITTGPNGRVWVAVTGADKLVWFDATASAPSAHEVPLGAGCGPVGIAAGGDGRMYFSQPSSGVLCGADQIGFVKEDGTELELTTISMFGVSEPVGRAYDLAVYGGKLFIPDYVGDRVRRAALGTLAPEASVEMPVGSGPQGIAADASGQIWVTLSAIGKLARFPASQTSGPAAVLTPSGGSLSNPFGIAAAGAMYVASAGNSELMGVDPASTYSFTSFPFDAEPWQVAAAPNGELWVSDRANARLFRVSDDPATGSGSSADGDGSNGGQKTPKLSLSASKRQKLGAFVKLKAGCGKEACTVSASGTLSIKKLKLKSAKAHVGAGRSATLKLKLPAKVKTAAAEALGEGKKPLVKVKVLAVDGEGNSSAAQVRQVTLTN